MSPRVRFLIPPLLLILLAVPWDTGRTSPTPRPVTPESAKPYADPLPVRAVIDGDTIIVAVPGHPDGEKVRLLNVDTAERDESGYREASATLRSLIAKRPVKLIFLRPDTPERDDYGRLLAYLFIGEANVNVEMVRAGWSRYWTRYGEGNYPEEFRKAETEARAAGRGIWKKK